MTDNIPFKEKIKTIQVMNRTGQGSRVRDVVGPDGGVAKETREGDPDDKGYVIHTESGDDRVDCTVQPNPVKASLKLQSGS